MTSPGVGWPEEVTGHRVPCRLPKPVEGEKCRRERTGFQALDSLLIPVDVGETQPQRELIERQGERHAKHRCDSQMPFRIAGGERGEPCRHQQKNAPEQMVNVQTGAGDEVPEWPMREELEVNDGCDRAQHRKHQHKGRQRSNRHPPAERQAMQMSSWIEPP